MTVIATLSGCNPFSENRVLDYRDELNELIIKMNFYPRGSFDRDEIDEFLIEDIRSLNIDYVVKNGEKLNPSYSGFPEENDSLIIFINSAGSIFDTERRIIYDYSNSPRNFGNEEIKGASYKLVQLDKRWYYSEVGFD